MTRMLKDCPAVIRLQKSALAILSHVRVNVVCRDVGRVLSGSSPVATCDNFDSFQLISSHLIWSFEDIFNFISFYI